MYKVDAIFNDIECCFFVSADSMSSAIDKVKIINNDIIILLVNIEGV